MLMINNLIRDYFLIVIVIKAKFINYSIKKQSTKNISFHMLISKKQTKPTNQSRNNSKNHNNQHTPLYSHRPLQSQYESVRNSEQKILKLRGNSKNNSKKNTSQEKSFFIGNKEKQNLNKHERKFSNAENYNIQRCYINLSKSNSPTSSMSSFHNQNKQTMKKPLKQSTKYNNNFVNSSNIRSSKDKISHDKSTSNLQNVSQNVSQSVSFYSKSNKQNMKILQSSQNNLNKKKKSSSKGLNLTKKSSNQHSYILEGYQKNKSKDQLTLNPKFARYEKPLSSRNQNKEKVVQKQKQISFDINHQNQQRNQIKNPKNSSQNNAFNTKKPQKSIISYQKYRKQSIDFQILFNKRKEQIQSNLQSFYNSHRNSFNNLHFSVIKSNGFTTNKVDDKSKNKEKNTSSNKNQQPSFNQKNQFNQHQQLQNNLIFSTANTNHLRKSSTNLNKQKQIKPFTSSSSFNFIKQTSQQQINKNSTKQQKYSQKKQESMEVLNSIIYSNQNRSSQQNTYQQKSKQVEEEKYHTYKKDSQSQSHNKKISNNQNNSSNHYSTNNHSQKLSVVQINSTNNNQVPNQIQKVIQIISQQKDSTSHRPSTNNNYMSIQAVQRQKIKQQKSKKIWINYIKSQLFKFKQSQQQQQQKLSLQQRQQWICEQKYPYSNYKQKFTVLKSPNNQNNQSARQIKKLSFLINQNNQKDSTRKLDITSYQPNKQKQNRQKQKRKYESYLGSQTQTQTHRKQKSSINQYQQMIIYNPNSFQYECVVGKGGFGKVWKAYCKKTNCIYALKQMSKALIISKKSVPGVMNQQQLLKNLKNPFLVNMCQSFQTRQNLYLVMDFLSGGDLTHHLAIKKYFSQEETKFIIICILFGLKYLHENNIIHRDIKPENIVLDEKGYARITDLGVARKWRENNCVDTSGTPGYMAPESAEMNKNNVILIHCKYQRNITPIYFYFQDFCLTRLQILRQQINILFEQTQKYETVCGLGITIFQQQYDDGMIMITKITQRFTHKLKKHHSQFNLKAGQLVNFNNPSDYRIQTTIIK